jgi:hypothetical protein
MLCMSIPAETELRRGLNDIAHGRGHYWPPATIKPATLEVGPTLGSRDRPPPAEPWVHNSERPSRRQAQVGALPGRAGTAAIECLPQAILSGNAAAKPASANLGRSQSCRVTVSGLAFAAFLVCTLKCGPQGEQHPFFNTIYNETRFQQWFDDRHPRWDSCPRPVVCVRVTR